ncbi:MAG: hypothetical protein IT290_00930, partial [Deltaproteobacteria bacterium]|nr:hypothetical protein [Deltaproteobacteria bacterium]
VSLLDDLFAIVRHEHDGPSMTSLPTDLEGVIRPVLQIFHRACAEKNLQFNAAPPPPLLVDSHPRLLTRALMNLLSNAVRATNMGSVELSYTTTADRVDIHVIDTGCGVPSHLRSELFERWTSDRLDGGVGLYLTRIFAESWGGYILYRPGAPTGSHLTLGMRRSEQVDANDPPPMLSSLLLIEDDLAFMRVLEREVHGVARSLRRATSLDAARRELRLNRPTFIIADRYLPDGDIETFLREADVAGTLPMIVLTGSCAPATRRDTPRSPLVEWIEKPFAPGMVREAITRLTARHLRGNASGGQECLAVGR